jgi:hypothetical protein
MRSLLHGILGLIGLATQAAGADAKAYGAKVTFRQGEALRFPDFELVYTGKRHVVPPQFPRGWWAYDFTAKHGKTEQKISWSAGTGDIGPTRFRVGGASFDLELSRSDKLGPLKEDELVVTRAR